MSKTSITIQPHGIGDLAKFCHKLQYRIVAYNTSTMEQTHVARVQVSMESVNPVQFEEMINPYNIADTQDAGMNLAPMAAEAAKFLLLPEETIVESVMDTLLGGL